MPKLKSGEDCCGCTACAAVCGHNAITMVPDGMGFKYPVVDYDKCVECGLCEKVCSFNDHYDIKNNFNKPKPYGARLKNVDEVMKSRSGGVFVALTDWILEQGGTVYGVGYEGKFKVRHKQATSKEERDEFRGSKYVQSNLDGVFHQVRKDLLEKRWVLFSGTGCQVAGLKAFLPNKLHEKLITVDIVCHGVPSPKVWADYIKWIEKKTGENVVSVNFRDKSFGWNTHKESLRLDSPPKIWVGDTYTHLFYRHILLRPSCGKCYFCNTKRAGDLTLADFWGWEKTGSHLNDDNKGLSLVLVNTPKGEELFQKIQTVIDYFQPKLEDCMQGHLKHPTSLDPKSQKFQKDYEDKGFEYVLYKYGNVGWRYKLKVFPRKVRSFVGSILRKLK